jgi:AcrR family transcriptional regulator
LKGKWGLPFVFNGWEIFIHFFLEIKQMIEFIDFMFDSMREDIGVTPGKGDLAQMAILDAAIEEFGDRSFDGARTRAIAEKSGQNLSAINYYFKSKKGLYLAVAKMAATLVSGRQREALGKLDAIIDEGLLQTLPRERVVAMVAELEGSILRMILTEERASHLMLIMMREQAHPTEAFEILYEGVMVPFLKRLTPLLSYVVGLPEDSATLRVFIQSIMGQILIFRYGQETIKRRNNWDVIGAEELEITVKAVQTSITASILGFKDVLDKG